MKHICSFMLTALVLAAASASAEDFNGDGTGDVAIFRDSSGLWGIRGVTRFYFGGAGDLPKPGDYSGNGTDIPAVFRGGPLGRAGPDPDLLRLIRGQAETG